MLLSRFWYLILSFALAAAAGILFVAQGFYNRHTERWMNEALSADASAVSWFLKDDARTKAAALLPVSLTPDLREALAKSSEADEVSKEVREKARNALTKAAKEIPEDSKFFAIFAVDADGRVVGQWNYAHRDDKDWNLGGHAVVADALAGWVRDDAWITDRGLTRIVARPVERDGGGEPIGAVIGFTIVDGAFAQRVSERTGANVAFYFQGNRSGAATRPSPDSDTEAFKSADFDVMNSDIKEAAVTEDYTQKGRSLVRRPRQDVGLVYTRMPGEVWELGSGYIVARRVTLLPTPLDFFKAADQSDKDRAPQTVLVAIAVGLGLLGLIFSIIEHTLPLRAFKRAAHEFAVGKVDTLAPSRFRGLYKRIAADVNDGVDKVLSKGGITRRAADLESVIGPLPAQPQMSAFAVPDAAGSAPVQTPAAGLPRAPERKAPPAPPGARPSQQGGLPRDEPSVPVAKVVPKPSRPGAPAPPAPPPAAASANSAITLIGEIAPASQPMSAPSPVDELADWKLVYEEFVKMKKQCGENTDGLTFDRFKGTLERNKAALVARHSCSAVKFTVYAKDGKAALRASPVK